ncbi:IS3 family transposase [Lysinibacillus sp. AR18-8]|uniref:IS3 family transposase n=1 Tax=Lysinibacillus sp. AR18-8 TaxID=1889781 RepID=UPI001585E02B
MGYRKITALLCQEMGMNHKVVQHIMQKYGWQCCVKVKKRKRTGQPYAIAANLLNRDFEATAPLQKLVTDKPEFKKKKRPSGTHEEWPAFLVFFRKLALLCTCIIKNVYRKPCVVIVLSLNLFCTCIIHLCVFVGCRYSFLLVLNISCLGCIVLKTNNK